MYNRPDITPSSSLGAHGSPVDRPAHGCCGHVHDSVPPFLSAVAGSTVHCFLPEHPSLTTISSCSTPGAFLPSLPNLRLTGERNLWTHLLRFLVQFASINAYAILAHQRLPLALQYLPASLRLLRDALALAAGLLQCVHCCHRCTTTTRSHQAALGVVLPLPDDDTFEAVSDPL